MPRSVVFSLYHTVGEYKDKSGLDGLDSEPFTLRCSFKLREYIIIGMQEVQKTAKHRAFKTQYYREWGREVERLDSDALTEGNHEGNSFPLSIILEQIKPWGRK